jgi:hypothetical protein
MARGHISASFHLQRSNKGPLESSRQGAHDRIIPTAVSGVSLAVSLTVPLAVSGVSYVPSSLRVFRRFLWPEAISQRVFISRGRTRAHWKALVKARTIVQ